MAKCPKKNGFFDFRPNAHGCGNYHCKGPNGEPKVHCGCAKCDHGCPHKCNKWGLCPGKFNQRCDWNNSKCLCGVGITNDKELELIYQL